MNYLTYNMFLWGIFFKMWLMRGGLNTTMCKLGNCVNYRKTIYSNYSKNITWVCIKGRVIKWSKKLGWNCSEEFVLHLDQTNVREQERVCVCVRVVLVYFIWLANLSLIRPQHFKCLCIVHLCICLVLIEVSFDGLIVSRQLFQHLLECLVSFV